MDLLRRLFTSRVVCLGYHGRPPLPYHSDFDWLGMSQMSSDSSAAPSTTTRPTAWTWSPASRRCRRWLREAGQPRRIRAAGGGHPGRGATLQASADAVLAQLGAQFGVVHGRAANLGDRRNELYVRPSTTTSSCSSRWPERHDGAGRSNGRRAHGRRRPGAIRGRHQDARQRLLRRGLGLDDGLPGQGARQGPPWNTALKSPQLSAAAQQDMWNLYESTVRYAASIRDRVPIANSRDWQRTLGLTGGQ